MKKKRTIKGQNRLFTSNLLAASPRAKKFLNGRWIYQGNKKYQQYTCTSINCKKKDQDLLQMQFRYLVM
jgi:hypothetical protein